MGSRTPDSWQALRVGDRIRFVQMPTEFARTDSLHPETRAVYQQLIDRRRSVRVHQIDEFDMPWIHCRLRSADGGVEWHYLLINHDGWVRVKPRTKPTK
jgi:hypothetical protein